MRSIAIVTPTFPPYRGGIGKVAEQDAHELAALGLDVHVYAPAPRQRRLLDERPDGEPHFAVHYLLPLCRYGNAAFVPQAAALLGRHGVTLLHYPFFGGAEPLWVARRLSAKGRLLLSYHMDVVGSGPLAAAFAAHARWIMPSIVRSAERIIVTSFDYAANSRLAGLHAVEPERFRELPPSVDIARFRPGPKDPALLAKLGLGPADRIVVFVGGLDRAHYFKGIPVLLGALAAKELAGAKAVIVGDGGLRPELERLRDRLGLRGRAVFAGTATEKDLPAYYRLGDVFAFPSTDRSEAFGIAALEALASGVPVVASDLPGVRTIVREGRTGLRVPPGSASALALRLASLIEDEPLRRRFGANAREMVEREYAESARTERWGRLVKELGL